jgi:hypothetical protein
MLFRVLVLEEKRISYSVEVITVSSVILLEGLPTSARIKVAAEARTKGETK